MHVSHAIWHLIFSWASHNDTFIHHEYLIIMNDI